MPKLLNLGITPLKTFENYEIVHDPIIDTVACALCSEDLEWISLSTYCVLTSKVAARLFLATYGGQLKNLKEILSIGKATTKIIESYGYSVKIEATIPSQEGIVARLKGINLAQEKIILPRSNLSRTEIDAYLSKAQVIFHPFNLYQTVLNPRFSGPDLMQFDGIYFSSSSCVKYFFEYYGSMPQHLKSYCIGNVTAQALLKSSDN